MQFKANAIESGPVGWNGKRLFLSNSELSKAADSLKGCPVYLEHNEDKAIGVVKNAKMEGNWLICEGTAEVEGYEYVSVGYTATIENTKGEHNNLQFDASATDIKMKEISFVDDPRYNDARLEQIKNSVDVDNGEIFVHNVYKIEKGKTNMFNIFNNKKETIEGVTPDSVIIVNEKETKVSELVEDAAKAETLAKENEELKTSVETVKEEADAKVAEAEAKTEEAVENSKKFVANGKNYTRDEVIKILEEVDRTDEDLKKEIENSKDLSDEEKDKIKKLNKIVKEEIE